MDSPTHTYTVPDVYTVALTVDGPGGMDTITRTHYITVSPQSVTTTITYGYDRLYRLTSAAYSSGEVYTYTYDEVGNRLAIGSAPLGVGANGEVTGYQYDDANRLTQVGNVEYTWDDNPTPRSLRGLRGNLLADGVRSYTYDPTSGRNRLIAVVSGTVTMSFAYNGDGYRMSETVNGVTTTYVIAVLGLPQVLVETTGGEAIRYVFGQDLLAEYDGTAWAYHLDDGLGSVRQLADEDGQVTLAQGYAPFGEPLWSEGSGATGFGFTGERWEAYTGLLFLRARYYEPMAGRFVQKDPWWGILQRPATLHRFVYVLNNAPNGIDPSGLVCIFGLGDCSNGEPDLVDVALNLPFYIFPEEFCLPGDLGCWGGREYADWNVARLSHIDAAVFEAHDAVFSQYQWRLVESEARRFGIPKELLASTIAAEVMYDTDWINGVYRNSVGFTSVAADFAYVTRDRPLYDLCYGILEGFHDYFGLAVFLEPRGYGYGVAPGIANMHAGPAVRTEGYFNENYAGQNLLPSLGPENQRGLRLRTLLSDEGSIRYAAAYLRWWADVRTRSKSDHSTDLTDVDMIVIYTAYRCDVLSCYKDIEEFQSTQTPSPYGHPLDFAVFLRYYMGRP